MEIFSVFNICNLVNSAAKSISGEEYVVMKFKNNNESLVSKLVKKLTSKPSNQLINNTTTNAKRKRKM